MAKKKFRFGVTVGVHDPSGDVPEVTDTFGRIITPGSKGLRHVPPGVEIEMDEAEAARIIERHGTFEDFAASVEAHEKGQRTFMHGRRTIGGPSS